VYGKHKKVSDRDEPSGFDGWEHSDISNTMPKVIRLRAVPAILDVCVLAEDNGNQRHLNKRQDERGDEDVATEVSAMCTPQLLDK
jgi:hypothetical protein